MLKLSCQLFREPVKSENLKWRVAREHIKLLNDLI